MESLLAGVDSSAAAEPVFVLETGGTEAASAATWPMSSGCLCSSTTLNPANITPAIVMELIMMDISTISPFQLLMLQIFTCNCTEVSIIAGMVRTSVVGNGMKVATEAYLQVTLHGQVQTVTWQTCL